MKRLSGSTNQALNEHEASKPSRRTSKHAPTEISSKKAVSRKRKVVEVVKSEARDPRFDPVSGGGPILAADEERIRRNYSFLDDYRESEMRLLKTSIKKTKDEEAKVALKRELLSMVSGWAP